jgi:hypothetical protein
MALVESADGLAQCPSANGFPSGRAPATPTPGAFPLGEIALDRPAAIDPLVLRGADLSRRSGSWSGCFDVFDAHAISGASIV